MLWSITSLLTEKPLSVNFAHVKAYIQPWKLPIISHGASRGDHQKLHPNDLCRNQTSPSDQIEPPSKTHAFVILTCLQHLLLCRVKTMISKLFEKFRWFCMVANHHIERIEAMRTTNQSVNQWTLFHQLDENIQNNCLATASKLPFLLKQNFSSY